MMSRLLAAVTLFCVVGTQQPTEAPRSLTVYYIPFHLEILVGVTTKTIRERAQTKFTINTEERVSRMLQAVATETPGIFHPGHVRLLVEQGDGSADVFVDAEGNVLRGGEKFTLGVKRFSALKALLKEIAPPS